LLFEYSKTITKSQPITSPQPTTIKGRLKSIQTTKFNFKLIRYLRQNLSSGDLCTTRYPKITVKIILN